MMDYCISMTTICFEAMQNMCLLQFVPLAWRNLLNKNAHTITAPLNNMQKLN